MLPIELGAEFVHGKPPELHALLEEAGLRCFELDGVDRCFEQGELKGCSNDGAFQVLEEMDSAEDLTFNEFLAARKLAPEIRKWAIRYVEGFNAADASRIGTAALAKQQQAEDAIEGDRAFRVRQGYDRVPEFLLQKYTAAGGQLFLSHRVKDISWQRGAVTIQATCLRNGSPAEVLFKSRRAIISVPLGVLQARAMRVQPEPTDIFEACDRMAMGTALRMTFNFREPFWVQDNPDLSFLFSSDTVPPTWWTTSPERAGIITGWVGGPQTGQIMLSHPEQVLSEGLGALARIFSIKVERLREQLLSWHMHDWQSDPYSLGAYSYAPKGALDASQKMATPVENTLFFAGEHTDTTGHWGTVHGALRSGLRAARQVLSQPR